MHIIIKSSAGICPSFAPLVLSDFLSPGTEHMQIQLAVNSKRFSPCNAPAQHALQATKNALL